MARTEDFDSGLWGKRRFEDLSPYAALFYIWSWTNTRTGLAGLYEAGPRALGESKVPDEALGAVLGELRAIGWVYYERDMVYVPARVDRLRPRSRQMATGVARAVAAVDEDHPLRVLWLERHAGQAWLQDALTDLGVTYPRPTPDSPGRSVDVPERADVDGEVVNINQPSLDLPSKVQGKGKGQGNVGTTTENNSVARAGVDQHSLPDDFPTALAETAETVLGMLGAIHHRAFRDGTQPPTLYRVGLAMRQFPDVDHETACHQVELWAMRPEILRKGKTVDLVTAFRSTCERAAGKPAQGGPSRIVQTSHDFVASLQMRGAA